jgi:hypothetical protein
MTTNNTRTLAEIVAEIDADWAKVNFAAKPYLDAMREMPSVDSPYFADSGKDMVLYFLSNASSWRGETAKRVKAELKALIK